MSSSSVTRLATEMSAIKETPMIRRRDCSCEIRPGLATSSTISSVPSRAGMSHRLPRPWITL